MVSVSPGSGRGPRAASPPWSTVFREQPEPPASTEKSTDHNSPAQLETPGTGNATARVRTQAWNAVLPSGGTGAVIGGSDWPALSVSARAASSKSSSSDGPPAVKSLISHLSPRLISADFDPLKPSTIDQNPSAAGPQQSARRPGVLSNGGLPAAPVLAQMPEIIIPSPPISPYGGAPRGGGFLPHPHGGTDHHRNYGGNRRGNNGGGSGGIPHQVERGGNNWNHRNRDIHMQQPPPPLLRGLRPYPRPLPPVTAPFIPPPRPQPPFIAAPLPPQTTFIAAPPPPPPPLLPQVRPFVPPMGYPDLPMPMYYVPVPPPGVSFVAHPPPSQLLYPPVWDAQRAELLKQIEYYFSSGNLCRDVFLRQKMDHQGWVPVSLIANFNRVKKLTNNIRYILDTVRMSTIVEVEGEKLRRRGDWKNWLLSSPTNNFNNSTPHSPESSNSDTLAARLQTIRLDGDIKQNRTSGSTCNDVVITRSASGNLNNQLQAIGDLNGDGNVQVTSYKSSDRLMNTRGLARSDTL